MSKATHNDLGDLASNADVPANTWMHVAWTFQSDGPIGRAKLWSNGVVDGVLRVDARLDGDVVPFTIGAAFSGTSIAEGFNGVIDEVTVWARALSGQEIQALAAQVGMCPPPEQLGSRLPASLRNEEPSPLLAYYGFESAITNDLTGNGHDGIRLGGVSSAPSVDGMGSALQLAGAQVVVVQDAASLKPSAGVTVTALVRPTSNDGANVIAAKWNDGRSAWSYIWKEHNSADHMRLEVSKASHNDGVDMPGNTALTPNNWYFLAFTYDSERGHVKLWVNGEMDNYGVIPAGQAMDIDDVDFTIGGAVSGSAIAEGFNGQIDELGLWGRALSGRELQELAHAYGFGASAPDTSELPFTLGLAGYWPFSHGSLNDASPNGRDAYPFGAIALAEDNSGDGASAVRLSGSTCPVVVQEPGLSGIQDSFTLTAMVRPATTSGAHVIMGMWDDGNDRHKFIFKVHNSNDKQRIELSEADHNDLVDLSSRTSLEVNTWSFVSMVFDGPAGSVRLYHNGQPDGEATVEAGSQVSADLLELGLGCAVSSNSVAEGFVGDIDEVAIWDRALSGGAVRRLAAAHGANGELPSANALPVKDGLAAYYPFTGGSGMDAVDNSGDSDATVLGATPATDAQGYSNRALAFDGDDIVVVPATSASLDSLNGFTVSALVHPTGLVGGAAIAGVWAPECAACDSGKASFLLGEQADTQRLHLDVSGDGATAGLGSATSGLSLVPNRWQHVAATFDPVEGTLSVYIDGELQGQSSTAAGEPLNASPDVPLTIGGILADASADSAPTMRWAGLLDEVLVYSRALSGSEIAEIAKFYGYAPAAAACELDSNGLCPSYVPPAALDPTPSVIRVVSAPQQEGRITFIRAADDDVAPPPFSIAHSLAAAGGGGEKLYVASGDDVLASVAPDRLDVMTRLVVQNRDLLRELDAAMRAISRLEERVAELERAT